MADIKPEEVECLVDKSKQGDRAAFDVLEALYRDRIYNYVARMVHDPIEAEDIAQEAFLKAYRNLPSFRGDSIFQTWLYRIASNLTIDAVRRRRRRENTCSLDAPLDTDEGQMAREQEDVATPGPARDLETAELQRQVHRAITSLSTKLRSVIVLYELQGLSYEEIADILGCPLGTVKSRLFNARMVLKERLEDHLPDFSGKEEIPVPVKPEPVVVARPVIREQPIKPRPVRKPSQIYPECGCYQANHSGLAISDWAGKCPLKHSDLTYEEMMLGTGTCGNCSSRTGTESVFAKARERQFAQLKKRGEA